MFQVPKKKRLFYNAEDDLHLLREVAGQNPFTDQARWQKIKENLLEATGKDFSLRSVKDRVTLLADQFAAKAATDQYKSGVEEDVTEKDDLLHSIILLIKDFKNKSKKVVRSQYQKGYDKRELAHNEILMSSNKENVLDNNEEIISQNEIEYIVVDDEDSRTLNLDSEQNNSSLEECMPNSSPKTTSKKIEKGNAKACGTPARVRTGGLKQTSIRYLEKKNSRWYEVRCRELALAEKKFEVETMERKRRLDMDQKKLEMDEKRMKIELEIFQNQQRLMEIASQSRCQH